MTAEVFVTLVVVVLVCHISLIIREVYISIKRKELSKGAIASIVVAVALLSMAYMATRQLLSLYR